MATIQSQLRLNDGMTSVLRSCTSALDTCLHSFEQVQATSSRAIDVQSITDAQMGLFEANAAIEQMESNLRQVENQQNSVNRSLQTGRSAADGLLGKIVQMAAAYVSMQGLQKAVELSDALASTQARLELIVDDGGSVADLQNQIMNMANNTRSSFLDTASAVAKMGLNAGAAFEGNDELIAFMEQVNKQFVIGGASAQEQANATLQLTQAMAAGALRGEELNSILDQAPGIARAIEQYMGAAEGSVKTLAEQGLVTSEVVKNALLSTADETNARFESMPMTWGQVWTLFTNDALQAFQPVLEKINELANSPEFQIFVDNAMAALVAVADAVMWIFSVIMSVAQFASENWSWLGPVIMGVVSALLAWKIATIAMTVAQWAMNAAMLASPITWVVLIIGALIAAVVWLANKVGGFNVLWQYVWTAIKTGALYALYGLFWAFDKLLWFFETIEMIAIRVWNGLVTGIEFAGAGIAKAAQEIVNVVLSMVNTIIEGINTLLGWAGVHIDTVAMTTFGDEALAGAEASMNARNAQADMKQSEIDAARADRQAQLDQMLNDAQSTWSGGIAEAERMAAENAAENQASSDDGGGEPPLSAPPDYTPQLDQIADNTGSTAEAMGNMSEELAYMRDIAEREAINRFTTASLQVDMTGMTNRIDSNMDVDGVITRFVDGITEELEIMAEGVHP
jgi:tape measure domain-containing protein